MATLLDYSLFLVSTYMYIMYFGRNNAEGGKTVSGLMTIPIAVVWFIYFVAVEAHYGATLAHKGLDLKVLTLDRKEIELANALRRHLLDPVDIMIYGIPAIIAIKNSDKHQRLGDMWAKTIVVDTSDPAQYATAGITNAK